MIISLYILTLVWIASVFSFARLRISLSRKKTESIGIHKDWICQAYLRISGTCILLVIIFLSSTH